MQHIIITAHTKQEKYEELYQQLIHILNDEKDVIARMSTICAAIKEAFNFYWIGFYRVVDNELVIGPYIGTLGCLRIQKGKGVCGTAWKEEKTIIVKDVNDFEGHIVCSSESKSEIVVPVFKNNNIAAVLDIDHTEYATFDEVDQYGLGKIVTLIFI
ncbi:MAG: GAF domain-containing protein [Bacteroidia bacterium]